MTGTKQSQSRQQATQSVSVLSSRDTIGLQSALEAVARLPNTAQQSDGFLPTIRGLDGNGVATGGGGAVTGANPRMSNYVDGVARTYGATPDGAGSFWDIAQVEVFYDEAIEQRQMEVAKERGFLLHEHALALYGLCSKPGCRAR